MHIGKVIGLSQDDLWDLYYTLLLKDAGCSSNAARLYELYGSDERQIKHDFKTVNAAKLSEISKFVFSHVGVGEGMLSRLKRLSNIVVHGEQYADELIETRCERGADIAQRLGFNEAIANGIRHLDEHWNGKGRPYRISGDAIPINSAIALLSQVVDVFYQLGGEQAAIDEIKNRKGSWFAPNLADAFALIAHDKYFWQQLSNPEIQTTIQKLAPETQPIILSEQRLDDITAAFGMIVDSKSPYTYNHSSRVAHYTLSIADELSIATSRQHFLRRGAFLHDIGKLGVSNDILDKPGKLTEQEWQEVHNHSRYTEEILAHIQPFAELAKMAGAHHERLDGKGYPYGLSAEEITIETRIITVADIFDAITAERPYRGAIPVEKTIEIMRGEINTAIDEAVLNALVKKLPELNLQ